MYTMSEQFINPIEIPWKRGKIDITTDKSMIAHFPSLVQALLKKPWRGYASCMEHVIKHISNKVQYQD